MNIIGFKDGVYDATLTSTHSTGTGSEISQNISLSRLPDTILTSLIEVAAHQKALSNLVLGLVLKQDVNEGINLMLEYSKEIDQAKDRVIRLIQENYAGVDFETILKR